MDAEWEDQFKELDLKMPPSEYWRRQCYATYQSDPIGVKLLDELGEDNIMWGSDFPHPDGIWPDSQEYIKKRARPSARGHPPKDRLRQRRQALPLRELARPHSCGASELPSPASCRAIRGKRAVEIGSRFCPHYLSSQTVAKS